MEDEVAIWQSGTSSMTSAILGRAMNNLLTCKPKKLEDAIARLGDAPASTSLVTLEDSLWFLSKYVRDAAERAETLDEVLIPMIENSLRLNESKNINQAFVLLNWLFQDEVLFHALAKDLVTVIQRKEDHYIALGWCTLIRGLVEYGTTVKQHLKNGSMGLRDRHLALLKILCSSISCLSLIVRNGSVPQDGFELPTRLAVAAADCILVLTEQLTKKPLASSILGQSASSIGQGPQKRISVAGMRDQGKDSPDASNNNELGLLLWKNLDNLIVLVEKLQCKISAFACRRICWSSSMVESDK